MRRLYPFVLFAVVCALMFALTRSNATAAPACSMNQSSLPDLIANYDPPLSTSTTAITVATGTLSFTCSGLTSGNGSHVYVELSGSNGASFVTPFLSGPNAFQLTYSPCLPNTGTCNGTTNLWQNTVTTAFKMTNAVNGPTPNPIPSFSVFLAKQDAFVGSVTQYTGGLFFSFVCGEGGSQAPC